MGTLYRIELNDEAKTTVKLGAPWPDSSPGPDGVPISDQYLVAAMFYEGAQQEEENEAGEILGEDLPAYFELWAQPKGVAEPPDDFPTFRMRLWLDAPMKSTIEVWKWADMEKAIALRMGFDPEAPIEPAAPSPPAPAVQAPARAPSLTAAAG